MFNFFKNKQRDKTIKEFNMVIENIKTNDETFQMVVGHGVNLAYSFFCKKYKKKQFFENQSHEERMEYFKKYIDFRNKVGEKDSTIYLGLYCFGIWLLSLVTKDKKLEEISEKELVWLSKKGEQIPGEPITSFSDLGVVSKYT